MVEIAASSTDAHNSKIAPIVVNPVKGSPSGAALANAANLVPPQKSNGKQGSSTTTATTATTAITATVTPAVNTAATPATVSRLAEMAAKMSMSNSTSPASSSDRLNHLHVPSTHHTHTHTHTHVRDDDDETHSCSASYAGDDYERLGKHQAACRFFDDFLANEENNNLARGSDIANFLKQCKKGISIHSSGW